MNPIEARAALDSIGDAQRDLALQATRLPPWRHAAFGAVMALLVGGLGFDTSIQVPSVVIAMSGVALIAADDRRRYGLFVNGARKGRTLPVTIVLLLAMLAAMAMELYARTAGLSLAVKLGIAALAFAVAVAASIIWNRTWRRELTDGAV